MALTKPTHTVAPGGTATNKKAAVAAWQLDDIFDQVDLISNGNNVSVPGDLTVTGTSTFNGAIVLGDAAADSLTVNATTTYGDPINYSNATGITAFAGGGQASATALTEEINNVTTVATALDSVKLPAAVAGKHVRVKNSGASGLAIYPAASDSIDALAVNLAIRLQPGSVVDFYAKDATVWESSVDVSLTLVGPTAQRGALAVAATDNTGDTMTVVTNAAMAQASTITIPDPGTVTANFVLSEAAATINGAKTFTNQVLISATSNQLRLGNVAANDTIISATAPAADSVYTIPDAGTAANFIMSESAQTINGIKTFGSGVVLPVGAVGTPSVQIGAVDTGPYLVSATQTGFAQDGVLVATFDANGMTADSFRNRVNLGTTPVGTVSIVEYGDGRDVTTVLTLTNFIVGALAGAGAALGLGNIVYAFPAGQHLELVSSLSSIVLTAAGTAVATDTGLGSVIATGAVSVLSGTATFEDRLTGQTINTAAGGGAAVSALTAATAGIGTGISLNVAASVKNVFLNSAGTWNADNTGNLTATGTITLKWTKM